jgi:phenylacetate-CoA ligase
MRLDDPELDVCARETLASYLVDAVRRQIAYMRATVPYWRERLTGVVDDESEIESVEDLARFPMLTKEELRSIKPGALLPKDHADLKVCRWTSGTSGRPTVNFWTATDWSALVASTARMLGRQAPMANPTAFNGYSQGHLTGPLYSDALRRLGGTVYDRSHHPEEVFSTLAQAELFDFDTLVVPGKTTTGKGAGLNTLLEADRTWLERHGVRWWIGSSGTFDAATVVAVRQHGVEAVSNLYGSSEFGMFAVSCRQAPGDFHISQGHVLVEVVDASGAAVDDGQFGRIVVTHLSGMDDNGHARIHGGTQIFRLAAGDGATFLGGPCGCGLTTPRLRNIQRVGLPG